MTVTPMTMYTEIGPIPYTEDWLPPNVLNESIVRIHYISSLTKMRAGIGPKADALVEGSDEGV